MMPLWIDDSEDDALYQYFEEPKNFIPQSVFDFYDEYQYYKDFTGSAPNYRECPARFLEMKNVYEGYLSFWSKPRANNEGYS